MNHIAALVVIYLVVAGI